MGHTEIAELLLEHGADVAAQDKNGLTAWILALQWKHIDFENKLIRVEQSFKFKTETLGRPKWGKVRATPLPLKTAKALKDLHSESLHVLPGSFVFCYPDGARLGATWWADAFMRAMKTAGIDAKARNLKPRSFRHTLATILADKGQQPEKIRAALGWTNPATQAGYTHWRDTDLTGQAQLIDQDARKAGRKPWRLW